MEYCNDSTHASSFPPRCLRGYDDCLLPDCMENDVAVATDGACVYGVSKVTRSDNGDVIATLSDTGADDNNPAYPFLK